MAETSPVRSGEEIDVARLSSFLSEQRELPGGEIEIEQFPAGSSNLTYLVRLGRTEYVLRRPPFGNTVKTAHDMKREFDVLSKLSAVYAPAPKPLIFCDDESVIGSEFYLMERRRGLIIRGKIPGTHGASGGNASVNERASSPGNNDDDAETSLLTGIDSGTHDEPLQKPARSKGILDSIQAWDAQNPESRALARANRELETSQDFRLAVCRGFVQNLAVLHSLDPRDAGLDTLGKPEGYNRRQVEGWTKRYFAAKTDDWDALEKSIVWLNDNIPVESGASLIHNDYKFDNVMLDPGDLTRITAVLDWEMVTIGDPLMDLGTTLGYWMSRDAGDELCNMPFNPRILMENITRQELVDMYAECLRRTIPNMLFYYVFGTFKIAVIAQQIYARYVKGFTNDERFASFGHFVAALGRIARLAIERKMI